MRIALIRHGATQGNLEGRYIGGGTDEALCEAGIAVVKQIQAPIVEWIFVSPMLRCRQTAELLYPNKRPIVIEGLRECAFGAFEGRNYVELNGHPAYQRYIDTNGESAFPDGESRAEFVRRSLSAFEEALRIAGNRDCAFVVHGGTIMAVMERYARPHGGYFDYQVKNGQGYMLHLPGGEYEKL